MRTFKSGRMVVEFSGVQTRQVLAGAYRGKDIGERTLLTHLVFVREVPDSDYVNDVRAGCAIDVERLVDQCGAEPEGTAPTCPTCLAKWSKVRA